MNLSVNDQPEEEENGEASMSQEDLFKELRIRSLGPVQLSASLQVKGWLLAACSLAFALAFLYASILSKMLPYSGLRLLDAIKDDQYFCFLVPLLVLPTGLIIYLNWLAMSHFQQN
eukprot:gene4956-5439_t